MIEIVYWIVRKSRHMNIDFKSQRNVGYWLVTEKLITNIFGPERLIIITNSKGKSLNTA